MFLTRQPLFPAMALLLLPLSVSAVEIECSIKSVLRLNETGAVVRHGWEPNYLDRQFTIDKETGRVLRTTALKQRLSNFGKNAAPTVVDIGDKNNSYKVVTLFEDRGSYAVLQIDDFAKGSNMPFFYRTNIGMMLTGLCKKV